MLAGAEVGGEGKGGRAREWSRARGQPQGAGEAQSLLKWDGEGWGERVTGLTGNRLNHANALPEDAACGMQPGARGNPTQHHVSMKQGDRAAQALERVSGEKWRQGWRNRACVQLAEGRLCALRKTRHGRTNSWGVHVLECVRHLRRMQACCSAGTAHCSQMANKA